MINETKIKILDLLSDGRWWTAPEVAHQLGISLTNASERLRIYRNAGLVRRRRVKTKYNPPKLYEYQITNLGLERLRFLTGEETRSAQRVSEILGLRPKWTRYIAKRLKEG